MEGAKGRRKGVFFKFHVKCNAAWTSCTRITRKRETSENEATVLCFGATVQQKENGVRAHNSGLLSDTSPAIATW